MCIEPCGAMRVPAIIYADENLIRDMDDKVYDIATLSGSRVTIGVIAFPLAASRSSTFGGVGNDDPVVFFLSRRLIATRSWRGRKAIRFSSCSEPMFRRGADRTVKPPAVGNSLSRLGSR
jgi:hypothetical protein